MRGDAGAAAGANRTDSEIIEKLRIALSRIDCGPQKSPCEQYTHWGAAIFCAHTLLVDVRATCPVWYEKAVRRKNAAGAITNRYPWRYLYTVMERLAEGLEVTIPEAAELGTEIYTLDTAYQAWVELPDRIFHLHFIRSVIQDGAPEPSPQENQSMEWLETAELDSVNMLPADVGIAKLLAESARKTAES